MSERDIQRWTREVAEDPGAASFVRLARIYRRQGRRAAAREVVTGGLKQNPQHVDAHALLALMYIEEGDMERAGDEWETVLRLDAGNFAASRGLGFLALERGQLELARRHLDAAAVARPEDPAVRQAREVLESRERDARALQGMQEPDASRNPVHLFAPLTRHEPFRGALVLDGQGLVLAGRLEGNGEGGDLLGALMNAAVNEADRTAELVGLGAWERLVLESEEAVVHVSRLPGAGAVLLSAAPDAPAGWVARTGQRALEIARAFLEGIR